MQRAQRLVVFGHSGAEPYGVPMPFAWPHKLSRLLDAELVDYGLSGAVLTFDDSAAGAGGGSTVINACMPFLKTLGTGGLRAVRRAAPYLPFADTYALFFGNNDIYAAAPTPTAAAAMVRRVMSGLIAARLQAGAVFNDDDTAITYGAGWTFLPRGTVNAISIYGSIHFTTTVGSYFDFAVPADHSGEIVFMFGAGGTGYGGTWTIHEGGTLLSTADLTTTSWHPSRISVVGHRVPLSPGALTLRITASAISGNNQGTPVTAAGFDSVAIRATADRVPPVLLMTSAAMPGSPPQAFIDIGILNDAIRLIPSEFSDGSVAVVDLETEIADLPAFGFPDSGYLSPALTNHPNEFTHAIIPQLALDAFADMPPRRAIVGDATPHWRMVTSGAVAALPNGSEPGYKAGWSPAGFGSGANAVNGAQFCRAPDGTVSLRGAVKKSTNPSGGGDTIFTLPPPYRPAEAHFFPVNAGQSSSNLNLVAVIRVGTDGNVAYCSAAGTAPAANATLSLAGVSFSADGGFVS